MVLQQDCVTPSQPSALSSHPFSSLIGISDKDLGVKPNYNDNDNKKYWSHVEALNDLPAHIDGLDTYLKDLDFSSKDFATHVDAQFEQPVHLKKDGDDEGISSKASGREVLQRLVKDNHDKYNALTPEESKCLFQEFEAFKATKAKGLRISMKSKIHDVTHTLAPIENELHNLKTCTGIKTMLFSTCGTTDISMKGIAFATQGVENVLEGAMRMDTQDFLGKMEGFAVTGVQGAAQNHQQRVSAIRGEICNVINNNLCEITGVPKAKMEWKHYWRNIVKRYSVIVEGWPDNISFENFSNVSSSLSLLEGLLRKWCCGLTYWKNLTEAELKDLDMARDKQIEDGMIATPAPRRCHSNFGKKRAHSGNEDDESSSRCKLRKIVSPKTVDGSDEDNVSGSGEVEAERQ
ncbi:hypothetical protein H0H87_001791 [Tephrocybe sp. NHM501043]|nr:hypothetical protein H0H87_001791 [Tephrocybe sp. NHM501043]